MAEVNHQKLDENRFYPDETERFNVLHTLVELSDYLSGSEYEINISLGQTLLEMAEQLSTTLPDATKNTLNQKVTNKSVSETDLDDIISEFLNVEA